MAFLHTVCEVDINFTNVKHVARNSESILLMQGEIERVMKNRINITGYVKVDDKSYWCTINNHQVKFFYGQIGDSKTNYVYKNDEEYLFGIDESGRSFGVLAEKDVLKRVNTSSDCNIGLPVFTSFVAPIIIRGKPVYSDPINLSVFDRIDFVGETINKIVHPRLAINRMYKGINVYDTGYDEIKNTRESDFSHAPIPSDEYDKRFNVKIDGEEVALVLSYWSGGDGTNSKHNYTPITINSSISLRFFKRQPICKIKQHYLSVYDFLCFMTGQKNVDFEVKVFYDGGFVGDCFFLNKDVEPYEGGCHNTIQIDDLGDKVTSVFELFASKQRKELRFLPENNSVTNRVTYTDVYDLCTAFEVEFEKCKESLLEEQGNLEEAKMMSALREHLKSTIKEFRDNNRFKDTLLPQKPSKVEKEQYCNLFSMAFNSISHIDLSLKEKIFLFFKRTLNDPDKIPKEKLSEKRNRIATVVDFRNDSTHKGEIGWGECEKAFKPLCGILYINILINAELEKNVAIKLADKLWYSGGWTRL